MNILVEFDNFKKSLKSEQGLGALREKAYASVLERGLPTRASEAWRYTNPKCLTEFHWMPVRATAEGQPTLPNSTVEGKGWMPEGFENLVFVDGRFQSELSSSVFSKVGIGTESESGSLVFKESLDLDLNSKSSFFETLQGAYFQKRYVLSVPPNSSLASPIHIVSIRTQSDQANSMAQVHLTLEIGAGSMLGLAESFFDLADLISGGVKPQGSVETKEIKQCLSNMITRIEVGQNAMLTHLRVQREGDSTYHFGQTDFSQQAGSTLESVSLSLGSKLSRQQLTVQILGEGATCRAHGAYVGRGRQHHDVQSSISHVVGGSSSYQIYKGLLDGESRGIFNGRIHIAHNAQKAYSEQLNSNLLLSSRAEADSKPQLEIHADDVKATHGSTVGPLSEEEVFYLLSRGIPKSKAIELLSFGFIADSVEGLTHPALRSLAITHLSEVFKQMDSVLV